MSDQDWSVKAAEAAIAAYGKASRLDLEEDKGPGLAIWHLLVSLRELSARSGIDFDEIQRNSAAEFGAMVEDGTIDAAPAPKP